MFAMLEAHTMLAASPGERKHEAENPLITSLRLLTTSKISELRNFYTDMLGFTVLDISDGSLSVQTGKSSITFIKTDAAEARPFYHFAFNIPENKINKALNWQRMRTPIIHPNPNGPRDAIVNFSHWNAHSIFFLDPAGNLLEYIARHDLKNSADGEFSSKDILYVSEIGFIVEDVEPDRNKPSEIIESEWVPANASKLLADWR
jgi:catechol 2,3-dioxygenase-like lactoylglutathione lyase family enzyme